MTSFISVGDGSPPQLGGGLTLGFVADLAISTMPRSFREAPTKIKLVIHEG